MAVTGIQGPFSDFAKKYVADTKVEDILTVLATRGIPVTEEARERISGCTDLGRLQSWFHRAITVDTVDALFD
jgi:hypothetical protein